MISRTSEHLPKRIRISIEQLTPLRGTAAADGGEEVRFEGWLELLSVLSALSSTGEEPGAEVEGGEGEDG